MTDAKKNILRGGRKRITRVSILLGNSSYVLTKKKELIYPLFLACQLLRVGKSCTLFPVCFAVVMITLKWNSIFPNLSHYEALAFITKSQICYKESMISMVNLRNLWHRIDEQLRKLTCPELDYDAWIAWIEFVLARASQRGDTKGLCLRWRCTVRAVIVHGTV